MRLTDKEHKVITTKADIVSLANYMAHCEELQVIHSYTNPYFRSFAQFSYNTLLEKLFRIVFKALTAKADHKITLKVNEAERTLCSLLFGRVAVPDNLAKLEFDIINNLNLVA